jgi:photosystem II stability/assembly factor-like uncharacterized protein
VGVVRSSSFDNKGLDCGSPVAAAAYTNGIYLSTNAGADWKKTSAPAEPWFGDIASSADGRKLVAPANLFDDSTDTPLGGPIYNSTDGGNTWNKTNAPTLKWYNVVSSTDGNMVAAAAKENGIYTSTDGGELDQDQLACASLGLGHRIGRRRHIGGGAGRRGTLHLDKCRSQLGQDKCP